MSGTHSASSFVGAYAAGVCLLPWADLMPADAADSFSASPGRLYDRDSTQAWSTVILVSGHWKPGDEAFRTFAGRDPSPRALQRRFGFAQSKH